MIIEELSQAIRDKDRSMEMLSVFEVTVEKEKHIANTDIILLL